jgi:hypothetical protein
LGHVDTVNGNIVRADIVELVDDLLQRRTIPFARVARRRNDVAVLIEQIQLERLCAVRLPVVPRQHDLTGPTEIRLKGQQRFIGGEFVDLIVVSVGVSPTIMLRAVVARRVDPQYAVIGRQLNQLGVTTGAV